MTLQKPASISAQRLAEDLTAEHRVTVLDVREDASWSIEGPAGAPVRVPAEAVLGDPGSIASGLQGPVVVVCARGRTADTVARALREQGLDTAVLEGGMQSWIGVLQAKSVELESETLRVVQVQRPGRGCLSYVITADGHALVVDPAPDVDFYIGLANELGSTVDQVFDTHLHADHLSGARTLADRTGATLRLPALTLRRGVSYATQVVPVNHDDEITVGTAKLRALALPGHTTDMTGLLVEDRALLSGDSLFADGIARPDLQRTDAEGAEAMARTLHETLRSRILPLGDDVLLLPGHTHPGVQAAAVSPTIGEVRATVGELSISDPLEFAKAVLKRMPPRPANYESIIAANSGFQAPDPNLEAGGNSCATR